MLCGKKFLTRCCSLGSALWDDIFEVAVSQMWQYPRSRILPKIQVLKTIELLAFV
jgi:hypothetical protein